MFVSFISHGTEFEKGELDPSFFVEEFLRSNADSAYTVEELIVKLASKRMALTAEEVQNVLGTLEARERVNSKMVRDEVYYIFRKPISYRSS